MTAEAEYVLTERSRRQARRYLWLSTCAITILSVACATAPPATEYSDKPYPSPLSGPGGPRLQPAQEKSLSAAWTALLSDDLASARQQTRIVDDLAQTRLLSSQIEIEESAFDESVEKLSSLTGQYPGYAAAWATLSHAAEQAGSENLALEAAREVHDLWPKGPYGHRAEDLENRWIDNRIKRAETAVAQGSYETALEESRRASALDPGRAGNTLIEAKALIGLARPEEAEPVLARLGDEPDALLLRSELATRQHSYQHAMDLLSRLPDSDTRKGGALRRARLQWRLSILPGYVQDALDSPALTRSELAVLVLALAPELENVDGGSTPLMPDIVNLPSQRAILTVARLGIINPDPVERRFLPDRTATRHTTEKAITVTCELVGYAQPVWCEEGAVLTSGCLQIADPTPGRELATMILKFAEESGP